MKEEPDLPASGVGCFAMANGNIGTAVWLAARRLLGAVCAASEARAFARFATDGGL